MPRYRSYKNKSGGYWRGRSRSGKYYTKRGCFIATAAYGSHDDESVKILRKFRDEKLLSSFIGRRIIAFYYRFSPPFANIVNSNKILKYSVRFFLKPIVLMVRHSLEMKAKVEN